MTSEGYHEPYEQIPDSVRDTHRAIVSLREELEAVDWYYQRAAVTTSAPLKSILLHNANEEIEHAMMVLEWIRRNNPVFDANMRKYLFKEGDIVAAEKAAKGEKVTGEQAPGEGGGSGGGSAGGPAAGRKLRRATDPSRRRGRGHKRA